MSDPWREVMKVAPKYLIGDMPWSFEPDDLDEEFKEKAKVELRETPEVVQEGLRALRELLYEEKSLVVSLDDYYLTKFLRTCKWYPKSAFALIKKCCEFRKSHPIYNENIYPTHEQRILLSGIIKVLPIRTSEGVRVWVLESGKRWDTKLISVHDMLRATIFMINLLNSEPKSQVAGIRFVVDLEGMGISQAAQFTPSYAASVVYYIQNCMPIRLKGIHFMRQPFIFNMVFALFKPFLGQKLKSRIHFHGKDTESLMKFIDRDSLPKAYGGNADVDILNTNYESFYNYCLAFEDIYLKESKFGII